MHRRTIRSFLLLMFLTGLTNKATAQVLTLKEAIQTALRNYGTIKAKSHYAAASAASLQQARREYLPDLSVSAQQDYGTVNGQTGPLYAYRGLTAASSGPAFASQNWNAAFGALYLANINWDFFSFGKARERNHLARSAWQRDERDLEQEQFQQQVRTAAAYLNLVAAQRLTRSQQNNLERAQALRMVVVTRVKTGLNAGVDSSLANAEVANAIIALSRARDYEQEQVNQLAQLMGVVTDHFTTDTSILAVIPADIDATTSVKADHPMLEYFRKRIEVSQAQTHYIRTLNYPTFSLFGVFQGRGSGFSDTYSAANPGDYDQSYTKGINPVRANYLFGIGVFWNLTSPLRIHEQAKAQEFISKGLQEEYELNNQRLNDQLLLADSRTRNAMDAYREAPVQVRAAADAYLQKSVLYKNGLSNIVDFTQALYALNRAETDRDIAYTNVWQALLLKAASSGDFSLFMNQL